MEFDSAASMWGIFGIVSHEDAARKRLVDNVAKKMQSVLTHVGARVFAIPVLKPLTCSS